MSFTEIAWSEIWDESKEELLNTSHSLCHKICLLAWVPIKRGWTRSWMLDLSMSTSHGGSILPLGLPLNANCREAITEEKYYMSLAAFLITVSWE